jgi:hypothetical protein
MDRKKRLFNRLLLVSGASAVLTFVIFIWVMKRSPQHYFIPEGYSGWVTVRFEKPGAPALPVKDGAVEYHIPPSGILETSTRLETGWSRDAFFWEGPSGVHQIAKQVACGDESCRLVHDVKEENMSYDDVILSLAPDTDTLLWDGTRISKAADQAEVRAGRKTMLHFWVSAQPEPFFYHHDSLPPTLARW